MVSSSDIPPAKNNGSERIAHHGKPATTEVPAKTNKPISVAVSKPKPNKIPSGYIFHDASIRRAIGRKKRMKNPRLFNCCSNSSSLYAPWRIRRNTLTIENRTTKFKIAINIKKEPLTVKPINPV